MSMSSIPEAPIAVVNHSRISIREGEMNLLLKGLSFCPTLHHIRKERIIIELEEMFFRCLSMKEFS